MSQEKHPDCEDYKPKPHPHGSGDCQTNGHYLCANCMFIADFENMELSDNRESYYPKEYANELIEKEAEDQGLEKCEFDDECDFCKKPTGGSYARMLHHPEDVSECDYYICGECVIKTANKR